MTERDGLIEKFLAAHGWQGATRTPLDGDASFRRYERLAQGGRRAMLMDAMGPDENVDAFVAIARHLKSLGFSAPDIFAKGKPDNLLLLEDLGQETYTKVLEESAEREVELYELAVDVLIALHGIAPKYVAPPGLPPYDDEKLLEEAFLLTDWALPRLSGAPLKPEILGAYRDAWLQIFPAVHQQPQTLVLRDFHVDNLMALAGRDGVARCGLLDFQDAVIGPGAYDLMSLLEDARRDIDPTLKAAMLDRYCAAFPELDRKEFDAVFAILAAQRHAKVIGIFTRLSVRDAKPAYLAHIPRVWRLLETALAHPALGPVTAWFEAHVPPEHRS
ncbi:MAG: phosphotransferase [Proteobacteria bacterium]|nr:phosphotransferase [Pseudomonadota bacterium]MDA1022105.1 phosphotransferase [Pseudomonadota bacterium]